MPWQMSLSLQTDLEALRVARKMVASVVRTLAAPEDTAAQVEVAVGEALANARVHAYQDGVGPLEILLTYDGIDLTISVHDSGRVVTPLPERVPVAVNAGALRRRGLYLIGQLMDRTEISRVGPEGGTRLRMTKRLRP